MSVATKADVLRFKRLLESAKNDEELRQAADAIIGEIDVLLDKQKDRTVRTTRIRNLRKTGDDLPWRRRGPST